MTAKRYQRNKDTFSDAELKTVLTKRVAVIGCGGLGGFVANGLARFGVGHLTLVDGDRFSESNLNRQLFATEKTLGQNKAAACKEQLSTINSGLSVTAIEAMLKEDNAESILKGHHLVIDCLDNAAARLLVAKHSAALSIPLVHGAIGGYFGQVASIFPGDSIMNLLYDGWDKRTEGLEKKKGNPVFTAQTVAALQVNEALKILAGKKTFLNNQLLAIDLAQNTIDVVSIG